MEQVRFLSCDWCETGGMQIHTNGPTQSCTHQSDLLGYSSKLRKHYVNEKTVNREFH